MATEVADPGRYLPPELDRTEIRPFEGQSFERDELARMYEAMRLARTFEERLARLYRQRKVEGAVYLGMGQEATSVGVASLMEDGDRFSTVARNLAAWFYRGVDPRGVMARWLGRDEEPSRGRELGLFHVDLEGVGLAPYHNGSMASWLPSGAGFALVAKRRGEGKAYIAFTGDGATSPGDFYEGVNLAAIHDLPLIIIAENNCYAYSTPPEVQMPVPHIADRAPAFGIPGTMGFGSDIFDVIRLATDAFTHARAGNGPYLVEFKCFRQRGHGEHDDMNYVDPEQRAYWEARDPLTLYRDYLVREGGFDDADLGELDEGCTATVDDAVRYAEARPFPQPESVTERVFAP